MFLERSKEILRFTDLILADLLSIVLLLVIWFLPESALRIILGIPFVLFFPGYMLICLLFPGRRNLDNIERIAFSIGLSIAVVPLVGLMLNYTVWGIRLIPILTSLLSLILALSIGAAYRRRQLPPQEAFTPLSHEHLHKLYKTLESWSKLSKLDKALYIGLAASMVLAGASVAYVASMPKPGERFTEFYLLGPEGKLENYPKTMVLGEQYPVIVGIGNHEYKTVNYRVVITQDGEMLKTLEGIKLAHAEKWEQKVAITPTKTGDKAKFEFILYKDEEIKPYLKLHLWAKVVQITFPAG